MTTNTECRVISHTERIVSERYERQIQQLQKKHERQIQQLRWRTHNMTNDDVIRLYRFRILGDENAFD